MKIRQDNDMIDQTGTLYVKNDTKLSLLIGPGTSCDENQVEKWRDWSYRCDLRFHNTELL